MLMQIEGWGKMRGLIFFGAFYTASLAITPDAFLSAIFWPITLPLAITYICWVLWLARSKRHISLTVSLAFPFIAYQFAWLYVFYAAIPPEISVTYPISTNSEEDGYCGTAVFKTSQKTLSLIKERGVVFFENATQPRGNTDPRLGYKEWKETPTPPEWESSEGSWLNCSSLSGDHYAKIISATKKPGAYYTTGTKGVLVIIPSLGYAVFSFMG